MPTLQVESVLIELRLERTRRPHAERTGRWVKEVLQARPPRASWVRPHTTSRRSHAGESTGLRKACTHSVLHKMARGPGWAPGGLITSSTVMFPRKPGRRAVLRPTGGRTGRAEARPGPDRPAYAREKE